MNIDALGSRTDLPGAAELAARHGWQGIDLLAHLLEVWRRAGLEE